jgi:O-antigen/teichoic acid export membrane protein
MFAKLKLLAGDSIIYGLSGVITRFITIFLIPIYTRIFNPADYGVMNLVNTTLLLLGIFVILGLDNATARWYWETNEDNEESRKTTFNTWFWAQLLFSLITVIIVSLLSKSFSKLILGDKHFYFLFIFSVLNLPLTSIIFVLTTWFRVKRMAVNAVVFSIFNSLLTIGISVYLVVFLRIGLKGVFLAQLISNFIAAIVAWYLLRRVIDFKHFQYNRLIKMLKYSLPLIPATLSAWLLNSAGGFFITHYASKTEVGLYQIGNNIASFCGLIFWAFLQAWAPFAISIHKDEDAPRIYSMVLDLYCATGCLIVFGIFLFSPEILLFLTTKDYVNAAFVAGILSLNIFIVNIAQITTIGSAIVKTNRPYAVGVIVASMLTVLFYFLLIPLLGKEGAAISTLLGSLLMVIYVTYKSQLLYKIEYKIGKNTILIVVMLLLVYLSFSVSFENLLSNILFKFFLILIFLGYLVYSNKPSFLFIIKKLKAGLAGR